MDGAPIRSSTIGAVAKQSVVLSKGSLASSPHIELSVT
jgi:hypothetical protein